MSETILALDFDGVLCDSAIETGMTGWLAAADYWPEMTKAIPPEAVSRFRALRPIIETGYESILAMRLIALGHDADAIYADFNRLADGVRLDAGLEIAELKKVFGQTRDRWIAENEQDWIARNPLFDGITGKLGSLEQERIWYVVTTKQERFVHRILQANGIRVSDENIFGLDRNLSKVEVLAMLQESHPRQELYFVEDRLPTLINVQKCKELGSVKLFFALWGYNTVEDKRKACETNMISPIDLKGFIAL